MSSSNINSIVIGVILGLIVGGAGVYLVLSPQISELTNSNQNLQQEIMIVSHDYDVLESENIECTSDLEQLVSDYNSLSSDYSAVSNEMERYKSEYEYTFNDLLWLSNNVSDFIDVLDEYCDAEISLGRVLALDEIVKTGETVLSITHGHDNIFWAYEKIHDYVRLNIDYVYDIPFPYIANYTYIEYDDTEVIVGFNVDYIENYVQTPEYTLTYEQGDCDDQAILEYAMIKYYDRYIYGYEYDLYYTLIEFDEGYGHACIIMPIEDGHITILDPAGNYLTTQYGEIATKDAKIELEKYDDHWEDDIVNIRLYEIRIVEGECTMVSDGDMYATIEYLYTS